MMWFALYSNYTITRLQRSASIATSTYASLISNSIRYNISYEKYDVERIIQDFDIPLIITDTSWQPITWTNIMKPGFFRKKEIFPDDTVSENIQYVYKKVHELKKKHEARNIYSWETELKIGYLVYGNNELLNGLRWMPLFDAIFVVLFSVMVYLAIFSTMSSEKSGIWVGLAKETAHQLGTPISSLMGWVEYLKGVNDSDIGMDPDLLINQVSSICEDMNKDLMRLEKVTNRFSQIGSIPKMEECNVNTLVEDNIKYFKMRLPMLGKKIEIKSNTCDAPDVYINKDLVEWVLENLFKNSVDAITEKEGEISVTIEYIEVESKVRIRHRDSGKGLPWDDHQAIFAPGYTTKKRGWGLGLALARRIIEEYHHGSIFVSWSQKGKGTEFCIDLPVQKKNIQEEV